jgi:Ca-activated chloride channel family protein
MGEDPVLSAQKARQENIVVNVIGVVDKGDMGQRGRQEAFAIAEAGACMCRIVEPVELSATVQMLTRQTMQMTLQQVVDEQLRKLIGTPVEAMPPAQRSQVMQAVDRLEDQLKLQVVVLVDTSASMGDKLGTVREAIRDLALSLQAREGLSEVAVVAFPGEQDSLVRLVRAFAPALQMEQLNSLWTAKGGTPTGPAIDYARQLLAEKRMHRQHFENAVKNPDAAIGG